MGYGVAVTAAIGLGKADCTAPSVNRSQRKKIPRGFIHRKHTARPQAESSGELVVLHLLTRRHYREAQCFYFYSKDSVSRDTEIKISSFLLGVFALISIFLSCDSPWAHTVNISLKIKIFFPPLVQEISPFSIPFCSLLLFVLGRIHRILHPSRLFITGDSLQVFFQTYSRPRMRNLAAKQRDWFLERQGSAEVYKEHASLRK